MSLVDRRVVVALGVLCILVASALNLAGVLSAVEGAAVWTLSIVLMALVSPSTEVEEVSAS